MNEKNISQLKTRLVQLGFEPSVENMLRCHLCFQPAAFDLSCSQIVGIDLFQFVVHVERSEKEGYVLRYYGATLRKAVVLPQELEVLGSAMKGIDWNGLVLGRSVMGKVSNDVTDAAFEVLEKMKLIGAGADLLKFKFWVGTALEPMIPQLSAQKAEWEISERFYFFDETALITFDDAVRFLSSRWIEKQLLAKKKLLVKRTVAENSSGSQGGSVSGGKLLSKNPRRLARRGPDKSVS